MNIQEELEKLEKQKRFLLSQKVEEDLQQRLAKAKAVEGKVFFKAIVTNRKKYMTYVWYKDAVIEKKYSNEDPSVVIKSSMIQTNYDLSYKSQIVYTDKHKEKYGEDFVYRKIQTWRECSVSKFKELVKLSKLMIKHLYNEILEDKEPDYEMHGIEYDKMIAAERTTELLDIPHIVLTNNQASYLGNSVFLRGNTYLITKASLNYAAKKLKIDINTAYDYDKALAAIGYSTRYDNSKEIVELRELIKSYAKKENIGSVVK